MHVYMLLRVETLKSNVEMKMSYIYYFPSEYCSLV